jgi:RHS repeat-associated protein
LMWDDHEALNPSCSALARDYDPSVGRWTTKDASRFGGGLNFYAYCYDDPVNLIDPTGFAPRPGGYDTVPEALADALKEALAGTASSRGNEFGGVIYLRDDGRASYTMNEVNKSGGSFGSHAGAVLLFHTHPNGNTFSPRDIQTSCGGDKLPSLIVNASPGPGYGTGELYYPPATWPSGVPLPIEPDGQSISAARSQQLRNTAANRGLLTAPILVMP